MNELKEARSLFAKFDKSRDVDAFIQAMHLVLDLKESGTDRERVIAENMFRAYWDSGLEWFGQLKKPYQKEIETTKQKYIDQGYSPEIAELFRFGEVVDPEIAYKIADLIVFYFGMMPEGKAPKEE